MSRENNAVFGTRPDNIDHITAISAEDALKANLGVDLPIAVVPVPSLGKCYPQGHPLCDRESVEIRPMTSREECIIMNRVFIKKGTVITELIKSCLVDKSIDPRTLLSGDRNALLVSIRITGYGAEYPIEVVCPECGEKVKFDFDLSQLPIKTLDITPLRQNENLFEFKLPQTGKVIGFKYLIGQDEEEKAIEDEKRKKLKLGGDDSIVTNLLKTVVSIDGSTDRTKIGQFVRLMPARDSLALRKHMRDNEPTVLFRQEMTCELCDSSSEVTVPLDVTFLWPDARR